MEDAPIDSNKLQDRCALTNKIEKNVQFICVAESKLNLKPFFKLKLKLKVFLLNWAPGHHQEHQVQLRYQHCQLQLL